jgi:crotonobetainyl-CoA:carnitine CoA-transferase CaiB-like acyl-CoA transferase
MTENTGPLRNIRVLDLTRILAGPTATQTLGDLGAEVIKIERPAGGDDTRQWGPPFLKDKDGNDSAQSAYFLAANRNKQSVAIDIAKPEGQALIKELVAGCDILIENFKVGGLAKYGLSYDQLKDEFPDLIYCSITGFGQTGPYAKRPGYDYLVQGMGGMMSLTGDPDGEPMKVGVGIADVVCGMYGVIGILAALNHRQLTGEGQHVDMSLLDTQVAWLVNEGMNYLVSGNLPKRLGNAHPNIVPYQLFPTSDGHFILAVGNDGQFQRFCAFAGLDGVAEDSRFRTNPDRLKNRDALVEIIRATTVKHPGSYWIDGLESCNVPSGPVNDLEQVFNDPQIIERGMQMTMDHGHAEGGTVDLIANPIKLSASPVSYRQAPPQVGEHTESVLKSQLNMNDDDLKRLQDADVIGTGEN